MIKSEPRRAILVLGMHRSGTSALAGVLSLCGASLPATLLPPADYNPKGFFESGAIVRAHQRLLAELEFSWDDPSPLPDGWVELPLGRRHIQKMAILMEAEFGSSTLLVLKDPRICRLVPFWAEVLRSLSIDFSFALPVRNPLEVAQSLEAAQGVPLKEGLLLWLVYFLQAERDTRDYVRSFIAYEKLLSDWRTSVAKLDKELGIKFPRMTERGDLEVDAFLEKGLRHQSVSTEELNGRPDISELIKEAYRWALQVSENKTISTTKIDRIFASLENTRST